MASKTARVELRLSDEKKERWTAAATERGYRNLTEFVDGVVEAELAGGGQAVKPKARKPSGGKKAARTGLCEHRRGPDEYCSRCD